MKDIDWSKAPEGATHWEPETDMVMASWMKVSASGGWYYWTPKNTVNPEWMRADRISQTRIASMIARPTTPQWNGTGLPPVDMVCEVMSTTASGEWLEATIVAHDGDKAVYRLYDGSYGGDPEFFDGNPERPLFRPIRTPEQIAAEERDKELLDISNTIRRAAHIYDDTNDLDVRRAHFIARYMHDRGYRMTVEDER